MNNNAPASHIVFTTAPCLLGVLLLAQSGSGICALFFADSIDALQQELAGQFPHASLLRDDSALAATLAAVNALLQGKTGRCDLPLDLHGSDFEKQVWQALQQIPRGQTASYSEIAARIGKPSAVRAVASACARNRLALLIPCHRVLRKGGALSGYRWGMGRKKWLLEWEAQSFQRVLT